MLSTLLLAGLFAAPIATAALFLPASRRARRAEKPTQRAARLTAALACSAVVIAIVAVILALIGVTRGHLEAAVVGLALACLVWLPVTRRWNARAHVSWATTTYVFVVYLAFMAWWTFASHLGITGDVGGMLLWLLELVAAVLGCAYLWELCDTLGRASWRATGRHAGARARCPTAPTRRSVCRSPVTTSRPTWSFETLESLRSLDYPNYEIQVSTTTPTTRRCGARSRRGARSTTSSSSHLSDWPGYKSGALNYALQQHGRELVRAHRGGRLRLPDRSAVPQRCAAALRRPEGRVHPGAAGLPGLAGRAVLPAPLLLLQATSSPSPSRRATSETAPSSPARWGSSAATPSSRPAAGTSGASPRTPSSRCDILRDGWSGLHVDQSFGKGIMPLTFEALKGQRFRWCFGGIQILRRHWRSLLPGGSSTRRTRLDLGQRWAYLSGAIQWYGDLLALLFFLCLLVGAANIVLGGGLVFRKLTGFLLAAIPLLVVARPVARGRAPAPRHRRLLARRLRRLPDLAVDDAHGHQRIGPGPVRQGGGVPAHAQDARRRRGGAMRSRRTGWNVSSPCSGWPASSAPGCQVTAGRVRCSPHCCCGRP